jgi:HK97 family phage prohead protease
MSERELRFNPVEIRAVKSEDGKKETLSGYGIRFGVLSEDLGGFRETIDPHALDKVLAGSDELFLTLDHVLSVVNTLGSRSNSTLSIWIDDKGLAFSAEPPDTTNARDAMAIVGRGDVKGMSFAFTCARDQWTTDETGGRIRTVLEIGQLFELSIVCQPAYPQSNVNAAIRSWADWLKSQAPKDADILRKRLDLESMTWKM